MNSLFLLVIVALLVDGFPAVLRDFTSLHFCGVLLFFVVVFFVLLCAFGMVSKVEKIKLLLTYCFRMQLQQKVEKN